jgi:signal transduction histidine kinase
VQRNRDALATSAPAAETDQKQREDRTVPKNPLTDVRTPASVQDLGAARERFLRAGEIDVGVRPVVREAWLRSRDHGVHPEHLQPQPRDPAAADRAGARCRPLTDAAEPYLALVHQTLGNEPHIVALADREGVVVRLLVDPETERMAPEANVFRGASWHERDVGCNAVGTALATGKPVALTGPEHFQDALAGWTRLGAPVRDADGQVAGAIELALPTDQISPHAWGWLMSLAQAVGTRLEAGAVPAAPDLTEQLEALEEPLQAARGVLDGLGSELSLSPTQRLVLEGAQESLELAEDRVRASLEELVTGSQKLELESRHKDRLLALISHELRGPLSGILSSLELLRLKRNDPASTEKALAMAEQQGRHMVKLLDDLRDVAAVVRGDLQLSKERVDLRAVVGEAVEQCRRMLEERRLVLTVQTPAQALWLTGDHTRLVQVATNLLSNAVKFTDSGGSVAVRTDREEDQLRLLVADSGVGIDPGRQGEIFGLFVQGDQPTGRPGTGIGLNLVSRLVHLHGGTVSVESEGRGKGTLFVVRLPADAER